MALPDKDAPGYLKFLKQIQGAQDFAAKLKTGQLSSEIVDELVEFLLPFIREPVDRQAARNALWEVSQNQFEKLLASLTGGSEQIVPPESAETLPSSTSKA